MSKYVITVSIVLLTLYLANWFDRTSPSSSEVPVNIDEVSETLEKSPDTSLKSTKPVSRSNAGPNSQMNAEAIDTAYWAAEKSQLENGTYLYDYTAIESENYSRDQAEKDLDFHLGDLVSRPNQAMELARECRRIEESPAYCSGADRPQGIVNFCAVLKDRCQQLTGENNVFFQLERAAVQGNVVIRLYYLEYLEKAITYGLVIPRLDPLSYDQRRNMGIEWLTSLAARDVAAAAGQLSRLYRHGYLLNKDLAQAYLWAEKASQLGHEAYDSRQLSFYKNNLTDTDLQRLSRLSHGRLP